MHVNPVTQPGDAAPTFNVLAAAATTCVWGDSRQDMAAEKNRGRWPKPRELCKLDNDADARLIGHTNVPCRWEMSDTVTLPDEYVLSPWRRATPAEAAGRSHSADSRKAPRQQLVVSFQTVVSAWWKRLGVSSHRDDLRVQFRREGRSARLGAEQPVKGLHGAGCHQLRAMSTSARLKKK